MAGEKILVCVITILVFFNLIFYVSGYNSELASSSAILNYFVHFGIIAVIIAMLPTTSGSGTINYVLGGAIMLGILYAFDFTLLGYHFQLGIGLASNLAGMFDSDPGAFSFLPNLFFNMLGLIGVISGMIILAGGASS